ncbi:SGNH/GDSL hydrolase family protein [Actinotalea caeni]|uniref:SGNH/GDSL hydrolase family protein n=1 Tax=Actinotalea caeni TaxID=1348467 RepID=UPI001F03CE32|nr:SGNH/GDSL hydrolase family protein [Actinotalea caeni]
MTPPPWASFVAIGDSFTEGLWDVDPAASDDVGSVGGSREPELRGWADRLALTLSRRRVAAGAEPLRYANLAVRGRRLARILAEQLPPALAMRPDLVSVVGGGIDVLRLGADPDRLASMLEDAVVRARGAGCDVLLATCMDTRGAGPLLGATRTRMAVYTAHIGAIARRHGCYVLDQWGLAALSDLRMWAPDRIHLSPEGHHRLSQAALVGLGLEPDDAAWQQPLPAVETPPALERLRGHGAWLRRDVAPWVGRGIRGTSTGDARAPKRPRLAIVEPAELADPADHADHADHAALEGRWSRSAEALRDVP